MTADQVRILVARHGFCLREAARLERFAVRREDRESEMLRDEAAEYRAEADALATLLVAANADVWFPDPRQMSLMSLGEVA